MDALKVFDLTGKVAVVTGGASGIGEATVKQLAAAGAKVVAGDLDEAGAGRVASEAGAVAQRCDVSSKTDVDALVDRAVAEFGRLDAMCNVAGIPADVTIADASEEQLDKVIAVNLKGVFFGCQAALRVMGEGASIVNVSSSGIDAPAKGYGLYAMTKAAVTMLTKTLAVEAGRQKVRVNAIAPGATITPFTTRHVYGPDGTVDRERYDMFVDYMRKQSPLRMIGEPEDQAWLIHYLVSDASRYCTGAVFRANGGQTFSW